MGDKPEIHVSLLTPFVDEATRAVGQDAVDALLARHQLSRASLADRGAWVTLDTCAEFSRELRELVDDPTFLARAAKLSLSPRYLGLLRLRMAEMAPRFNKVGRFESELVGPTSVRIA